MFVISDYIQIVSLSALVFAMPGPTNTLLLSSGLNIGFIRSIRLIGAEMLGYLLAITTWGTLLFSLALDYPGLSETIKSIGSLYLIYLAIKIWRFSLVTSTQSRIGPSCVFIATLFNPKAFILAGYILPDIAFTSPSYYGWAMLAFMITLIPVASAWTCLGIMLRGGSKAIVRPYLLFRSTSLLLLFFSCSIIYSSLGYGAMSAAARMAVC